MSPIALPPSLPAASGPGQANAAQPDAATDDFAGVLDGAAPAPQGGTASRHGAKAATDPATDDTGDVETGDDEPATGSKGGQGNTPLAVLDITLLAQMAAATPPLQAAPAAPRAEQGTTARGAAAVAGASLMSIGGKPVDATTAGAPPQSPAAQGGVAGAPVGTAVPQATQALPSVKPAAQFGGADPAGTPGAPGAPLSGQPRVAATATAATAATSVAAGEAATPAVVPPVAAPLRPVPARAAAPASVTGTPSKSGTAAAAGKAGSGPREPAAAGADGAKAGADAPLSGAFPVAASSADPAAAMVPTPAQQVTTALQSLVSTPDKGVASAARGSEIAALPATVSTAGGVRTVTIALAPEHLGPVSVTVRMKADAVEIEIAVSNPQALHLLERDRHALSAAVEALGGSGASLHLAPAAAAGDGASAGFGGSSQTSGRQEASSDAASAGRGNQNRSAATRDASESDSDDTTAPSTPAAASNLARDGSLYL